MKLLQIAAFAAMAVLGAQSAMATNYVFEQSVTSFAAGQTNVATTPCPSGYYSVSGGYSVAGPDGANGLKQTIVGGIYQLPDKTVSPLATTLVLPAFVVSLTQPVTGDTSGNGAGWAVGGYANQALKLTVFAVCGPVG